MNKVEFNLSAKYPIETIRYVLYSLTSKFWIKISKQQKDKISVTIESKDLNQKIDKKKIFAYINTEIEKELTREYIFKVNKNFRKYIIKKAITYQIPPENFSEYSLTPEEQRELEKLIREAEEEIKKELKKEKKNAIEKKWEEKYSNKS